MSERVANAWLRRYALVLAGATVVLLASGGLVTSKEAGLAVPDWPTTYGYNLFLFPVSRWVGGVLYEHGHRLLASGIGLMTLGLAVLLACFERRRWVRYAGFGAVILVILQGVLGGLRVVLLRAEIGVVHAGVAQAFLALLGVIALGLSPWWERVGSERERVGGSRRGDSVSFWISIALVAVVVVQLLIGAAMRHAHLGLSIPDFPLAYGKVWPALDAESLGRINEARRLESGLPPTTAVQIVLQLVHRAGGIAIVCLASGLWWAWARRRTLREDDRPISRLVRWVFGLVSMQFVLGVATIWTGRHALVATAHVVIGSVVLLCCVRALAMLARRGWRRGDEIAGESLCVDPGPGCGRGIDLGHSGWEAMG